MNYFSVKKLIQFSSAVFIVLCGLSTQLAFSQTQPAPASTIESHERWYQIEMIIFSRGENNQQENWPTDIKLSYPANVVSLRSDNGASAEGFNTLSANERLLNPQAATLARSGSYTVLFHQAWRQMIYGRNTNILISGGKTFNGHQELEGNISISVAQYLKLQTNLWLTQFTPAGATATTTGSATNENWPELPALPNSALTETDKATDYVTKRIVKISQQRSMRSNEIHYIDHPLLGIIIKIVPYDMPGQ